MAPVPHDDPLRRVSARRQRWTIAAGFVFDAPSLNRDLRLLSLAHEERWCRTNIAFADQFDSYSRCPLLFPSHYGARDIRSIHCRDCMALTKCTSEPDSKAAGS